MAFPRGAWQRRAAAYLMPGRGAGDGTAAGADGASALRRSSDACASCAAPRLHLVRGSVAMAAPGTQQEGRACDNEARPLDAYHGPPRRHHGLRVSVAQAAPEQATLRLLERELQREDLGCAGLAPLDHPTASIGHDWRQQGDG